MGPWCPETLDDGPEKGGLWIDNGEIYDVDGAFIENLETFYGTGWKMYDEDRNVIRVLTKEECEGGARPNPPVEYQNMCAQCEPEWIEAEVTYLIPITPVKQEVSIQLGDGPTLDVAGVNYGPLVRGLAFNVGTI